MTFLQRFVVFYLKCMSQVCLVASRLLVSCLPHHSTIPVWLLMPLHLCSMLRNNLTIPLHLLRNR